MRGPFAFAGLDTSHALRIQGRMDFATTLLNWTVTALLCATACGGIYLVGSAYVYVIKAGVEWFLDTLLGKDG